MTQAGNSSITRRGLIAGAAVAGLSTAVGHAAASADDVLAFEPKVAAIFDRQSVALENLKRLQRVLDGWLRRNPEPEYKRAVYLECKGDDPEEYHLRHRVWRLRKESVVIDGGYSAAKHQADAIEIELLDAADQVAECASVTLAGLQCKARIANKINSDTIAWSVVDDLNRGGVA